MMMVMAIAMMMSICGSAHLDSTNSSAPVAAVGAVVAPAPATPAMMHFVTIVGMVTQG